MLLQTKWCAINVDDILHKLEHSVTHDGASPKAIVDLERSIGKSFPSLYRELMHRTNGIEGFLSQVNYVQFWNVDQLIELNEGYGAKEFAPGLFLFGSNGGDAGYAFDIRSDDMPVYEVPFIGLSLQSAKQVGASFKEFLKNLCIEE
jgi:hypothetical protein